MNDCVEHFRFFGRNKQNSYAALTFFKIGQKFFLFRSPH